jgi:hypothetical protein
VAFTVRPEDAEKAAGVNAARLGIVLAGALLYVAGGAGLAVYCFTHNASRNLAAQIGSNSQIGSEEDIDEPSASPPVPALRRGAVSLAEQRRIDDAIAKGVWFLKDNVLPTGTWGDTLPANGSPVAVGFGSLPALTLLECGVPGSDAAVGNAAAFVRQRVLELPNNYDTYQRALAILFLDRLGDKHDEELIQYLALCIMAGQHPTEGAWSYACPTLDRALRPQLLKQLEEEKHTLKPIGDEAHPLNDWRKAALKGGAFAPNTWDHSNTQFAILALWVARRHGAMVDWSIELAEKHFRATQLGPGNDPEGDNLSMDGSWYYDRADPRGWRNSSKWPSMTCAGLLALAEGYAVTQDPSKKLQRAVDDPAIKRAFAMLAREIDRSGEKRAPDLYFLWSLERVGVLYSMPRIGGKDWYTWGCQTLLAKQAADGSWNGGGYYGDTPVLDTCFALLFLKQANLTADLSTKLEMLEEK